jgi:hypothetical protein
VRRATPGDRLLARALANGATVESERPKPAKPRAASGSGDLIHRLTGPRGIAARGWHGIECQVIGGALVYRLWGPGRVGEWGGYEEVTGLREGPKT